MNYINFLLIIMLFVSCQDTIVPVQKTDLFKDAISRPLVPSLNLPVLKNEFFDDFTPEEIRLYADKGIHIRRLEDLFMRGITTFISIKQVELEDDVLTIHFSYRKDGELIEELLMSRR